MAISSFLGVGNIFSGFGGKSKQVTGRHSSRPKCFSIFFLFFLFLPIGRIARARNVSGSSRGKQGIACLGPGLWRSKIDDLILFSFFTFFGARREVGENDNDRLPCNQQLTGDDRHTFGLLFHPEKKKTGEESSCRKYTHAYS